MSSRKSRKGAAQGQTHRKPLITVAVRKRRKQKNLEEYRRKFTLPSYKVSGAESPRLLLAPPAGESRNQARETADRKSAAAVKPKKARRDWGRRARHVMGATRAFVMLALLRGYHSLSGAVPRRSVAVAGAIAIGFSIGALYAYRTVLTHPSSVPAQTKRHYERLTADIPPLAGVSRAPERRSGAPARLRTEPQVAAPLPAAVPPDPIPVAPPELAVRAPAEDQPTVVRSETYLPNGTRADAGQEPPAPGTFVQAAEKPADASRKPVQEPDSGAAVPIPPNPPAEPQPASDHGYLPPAGHNYFAQLRSDQDQKNADAELAVISQKYKAALGGVDLTTRQADLKDKGIWFRVLAGPLGSRDEVASLCKRLKSAGYTACIVQTLDESAK